ncbi:hypothetical protein ICN84_07925 [Akkermansia glycaniphila]|uniref:MuF-C-terminal domain-containing protein n=1 Tax=Akkermansia glycaniphila TaxID=1679444 RepID=UPI001C035B8D|nr:hypothetical protein [Akkermansia glycaniphila]MBT9450001.1 hypothetical protein [Akkermansia glycaniphila]
MENPYFIPTKPATAEPSIPSSTYVPGRYNPEYDAEFMPVTGVETMPVHAQLAAPDIAVYDPPSNEDDRQYELDAMANYVLGNEYEECRKKAEEVYGKGMYTTSNEEDRKYLAGRAICRSLYGDDGVPDVYFRENNLPLPSDDKDAMYIAIHDDFREKSRKQYETVRTNRERVRQEQDRISKDIIRCVSGDRMYGSSEVPPELLQYSENPEQLGASIKRARGAFREFMDMFEDGSLSDFSRNDALKLIGLFSKEDRNGEFVLDEDALSLFATAANAKMDESQDGNTHFWRNFGDGLKNAKKGYEDLTYWRSGQGKDWVDIGGGTVVPAVHSGDDGKELEKFEKNRKAIEKAMGMVDYLNSVGTSTSKDAAWYVKAVNGAGKAFGDTALYFVPSVGWQMAFASSLGNNLNQAAYTGESPYDALVNSIRETAEEKVAFSAVGQLSAMNRLVSRFGLSRIAAKMPMMVKLEGKTAWRMGAEFGMGTLDELVLEPMVGEPLEYGMRKGLRAAGFELQDKDFDLIGSIYRNIADEETSLGTALFVGIMVGGHGRMINRQAREFAVEYSKSVERLEQAGLKKQHAQELAHIKNDDVRAEKTRMYLETDVLHDPVGARDRAEKAGRELIDRQEAELYRMSGAIDDVLARNGVGGVEFLPEKGTYKVSYEDSSNAEGEGSARSVEMTGEQLDAYIQLSFEAVGERELRHFTARVFGSAMVREAGQANDGFSFLDAREIEELNRDILDTGETYAGGFVTERGIGALVERAKTAINELADAGTPMSRALSLDSVVKGVPNEVVSRLQDAVEQRMEVPGNDGKGFASRVWRMRGVSPASSVIAYAKGHANALEVWEDVVESHLATYLADGAPEQQAARLENLGRSLQEAQRLMKEQGISFKEFIATEGPVNAMQVTEAFSSLAQGEELYSFESWNVPDWVKNMMRFVLRMMNQAKDLLKMGEAWSKVRRSGKFDEFKRKHGDLVDLLESSGAKMESIFARARIEAEDSAAVRMAMDEAVHALRVSGVSQDQSLADIRRDVEEYTASRSEEEEPRVENEEVSAFDAELELRTRIASGKASLLETAEFARRFMETLQPGANAEMALREAGVVQADLDPERRTASQMGAYLGIHAGDELMQAVRDGSVSGLDAYRICKLSHDGSVQDWALKQMADGKTLDFLTPSIQVRDAVAAGVELFDSPPTEDIMEHVADYVRACRTSVTDKVQLATIENMAGTRAVADAADAWIEGDIPVPPLFDDAGVFDGRNPDITFSLADFTDISDNWKKSLGDYLDGRNPEKRRDIVVCPTPAVLRMLGAKPHDLVITPGVIDKVAGGKHSVSRSAIEQLPSAVSDPICIAVSDTAGSIEIVTDLKEGQHHILVAVQLNTTSTGSRSLKVNRIASIYGKEKINALLNHPMLYWNKTKARVWTGRNRLQLPVAPYPRADSGKKILKPDDVVKWKMKHGISFSMADMSEVAAMALAPRRGEVRVESLLRGIKTNIRSWRELCAATKTDKEAAAAVYGQIASVLSEVNRTLPEGYRIRIAPYLRAFEAYSKMIGTGRYYAFSHLKGDEKAEFAEQFFEELDAMMDAPEVQTAISGAIADAVSVKDEVTGRGERKIERIYKEYREEFVKKLAEGRVENMLADMLTAVRGSLETYLKDVAVRKGMAFIDAMMPKKKPSGKYGKGAMAASGYRQLGEYIRMLEADRETVDANLARIKDELGKTGETEDGMKREAELNAEMGDWTMFGCLEEMNLDQARNAMNSLTAFAASERLSWREKEKSLVWQREKMAVDMAVALEKHLKKKGREVANDQTDRDQSHDAKDHARSVAGFVDAMKSFGQRLDAWRELPGMAPVMNRWIDMLSSMNINRRVRENNYVENVEGMVKRVLGFQRRRDVRKWIRDSKKTMETGATVKPVIKKTFEVPAQIAKQWVSLWENADVVGLENLAIKLNNEAAEKGVLPERLGFVYRDEIPALKEAMQSHRGGKYVSFERETVSEDGSIENLRLTRAEAMYTILLYEQERYRKNFEKHGYTEETMQKLYEFVGEDGLKVAYGLRDLLNTNGEELAAKYEQLTGVPFPKEDNYFHAVWRNDVKNATAGVLFGDGPFMSNGHKYGITVTRRNHNLRLDLSKDAFLVCEATVKEADHYICVKELVDEIRGVLSHKRFQENMKAYLGQHKFNQFVEQLNYLDGAGSADAACLIATGKVLSSMQSGKALALLAWKALTVLKQTSGLVNPSASGRINLAELVKQMTKDRFGVGHFSFGGVAKHKAFTSRINRNVEAQDVMRLTADRNRSAIKAFAEWGMKPMEYVDLYSNIVSHQALLNATYAKLEAENRNREKAGEPTLSVAEMEEQAWREARASLELTAQPVSDAQRSLLAQKGGFMTKLLTFMAGDAINKFGMVLSLFQRGRAWKALGVFATMSVFEQAVVGLWQLLIDTPGDDDEWKSFYKANAIGAPFAMLGAVPVLGAGLQGIVTQFAGMRQYRNYGGSIINTESIIRSVKTMIRAMDPDDHKKNWEDGMKSLFSALQDTAFLAGAGADSRSKAISSISSWMISLAAGSNIVKTGMQIQKGAEKRARDE